MNMGQNQSFASAWSKEEKKAFDNAVSKALKAYPNESHDRLREKVTAVIPGRTVEEHKEQYDLLVCYLAEGNSQLASRPHNVFSGPSHGANGQVTSMLGCGKIEFNRNGKTKPKQKRRKGVAWSEEEHRRFVHGLKKYGKGDWRSISRHCVVTRTSTQVASHAQKFFLRLNSNTDKTVRKRPSIHDVTVDENQSDSKRQRSLTWPNSNINIASSSNIQANQTTSQPSSLDLYGYGRQSSSLDVSEYSRSNGWNIHVNQANSPPSLNYPPYGASSTIWNTEAALQPSASNPMYGTFTTTSNPVVRSMMSPFEANVNRMAPPQMTYGGQQHRVPYYLDPNAVINLD